ncbi:roadblock/LC7 domain-containing protein [Streptomyces niger]|uniref:roadblock/LC7 domain-containing protein n=1 Tax=Streptomyces niger TaxID=66373 RepID=UPI00069B6778|nr:roadblock/LC7 domain-containing protein [Streptomyces niger]
MDEERTSRRPTTPRGCLGRLLDDLTARAPEIRHAVVLNDDGLVAGASSSLLREDADHLAAVASGFHSLARGTGRHFSSGELRQTMVEMEGGFLFVAAVGDGACLAVLSSPAADIGLVAYETASLVRCVAEHLYTASHITT